MRMKTLAFVAGFCLFGAAAANAAPVDGSTAFNAYLSWISGWSAYLNSLGVTWFDSLNTAGGSGGYFAIVGNVYAFDFPTTGETLSQVFLWNISNGNVVATPAPVPVPGPEAGAGIGALALGGVAYLVSRRRRRLSAV